MKKILIENGKIYQWGLQIKKQKRLVKGLLIVGGAILLIVVLMFIL